MTTADTAVTLTWPEEDHKVPREIYTDPDIYRAENHLVWTGPTWILVAHDAEIPNPGDFKTHFVGDVPVVIVRNLEGQVNVLVNTCAHRGAAVMERQCGNLAREKRLTCIYHHWNYDLDGQLRAVSLPDSFPDDFRKENYGLTKARVGIYKGAIFATFSDETPDLEDYLGGLKDIIDAALGDGKLVLLGSNRALYECNWKLFTENLYDGYHAQVLHKAIKLLGAKMESGTTHAPTFGHYGHLCHEYRTLPPAGDLVFKDWSIVESITKSEPVHYVSNVFPAGVIQNQQDTIALRFVIPRGVDKVEVHFTYFGRQGESEEVLAHRISQGSNLWGPTGFVSMEDAEALHRVQQGVHGGGETVILKGSMRRFPPYRFNDEAALRHFYYGYRTLMGFYTRSEIEEGQD